jgi:urea transport system substrate-binding protein
LSQNKITAEQIPVCAFSVAEDELRGLSREHFKGHLAAWNYFQSVKTPANAKFVQKYKDFCKKNNYKDKDNIVTDDPIEASYFQVYFWKLACEKAGSFDVDKVREAVRGIEFDAPGGKVKVDEKNQHTWKPFRMGEIQDDGQFKILYETKEWVRPDPYPAIAFPGKGCDQSKGGDIDL